MVYDVLDVCEYIIDYSNKKDFGISNLKLQKILYFVQAYFLISANKKCFDEKIEAWDIGPVVPEAYREYKRFGGCDIPGITHNAGCPDMISETDRERINAVVDKFSEYSSTDLTTLTQHQTPWMDAYCFWKSNEITTDAIKKYFDD